MPVWPGATQVVQGDAPVAAGCATVVCRWRPGDVPILYQREHICKVNQFADLHVHKHFMTAFTSMFLQEFAAITVNTF